MIFTQSPQGISTMSTAAAMVTSRSISPLEKEKWLKFHDGEYQFKVRFMLYAGFESILKSVDEWYRVVQSGTETR